jgi:predicted SAM-dependent methyltransferase
VSINQIEGYLKGAMPDGWTFKVRETTNTVQITAKRPRNEGTYRIQIDRRDPMPDVSEFARMCAMLSGRTP